MTHPIDLLLHASRHTAPVIGVVTGVDVAGFADVDLGGSTVKATLTDQTRGHFITETGITGIGTQAALIRLGQTYTLLWTLSGSTSGGGLLLGSNLIPNAGFEFGIPDTTPDHWTAYDAGFSTVLWDNTPGETLDDTGRALVRLPSDTAARSITVASAAIMIDAGIAYQAAKWVKASAVDASLVTTLAVLTAPDTASAIPGHPSATEHLIANVTSPGSAYQFALGNVIVPSGHGRAGLLLKATAAAGPSLEVSWDETSLRQLVTS